MKKPSASSSDILKLFWRLTIITTFGASLIRGIDALFLIEAGLTITQVFTVYAFMTVATVLFEVPTGIVADTKGRRTSYLYGAMMLFLTTLAYVLFFWLGLGFIYFAISTFVFGIGFTFFSGATEAWLVDALKESDYKGSLESIFSRAQVIGGISMLAGTVLGGLIAQFLSLSTPYVLRAALYLAAFALAYKAMRDIGFTPEKNLTLKKAFKNNFADAARFSFKLKELRWMMIGSAFAFSVVDYIFYAMQPYLLELIEQDDAYWIASLAAAIFGGAQIAGGILNPRVSKHFKTKTGLIITGYFFGAVSIAVIGVWQNFYVAITAFIFGALLFSVTMPTTQSFLNSLIPSDKRATVLSFNTLISSLGGIAGQPSLGRFAETRGFGAAFILGGIIQLFALPLIYLSKLQNSLSDKP